MGIHFTAIYGEAMWMKMHNSCSHKVTPHPMSGKSNVLEKMRAEKGPLIDPQGPLKGGLAPSMESFIRQTCNCESSAVMALVRPFSSATVGRSRTHATAGFSQDLLLLPKNMGSPSPE